MKYTLCILIAVVLVVIGLSFCSSDNIKNVGENYQPAGISQLEELR